MSLCALTLRKGAAVTRSADVVIIGGGVIGASVGFHLTSAGAGRVILVERGHLAAGATGKSHGVVRMHYTNPHDARLALLSLPYFHDWEHLVGAGDCQFDMTGVLRFARPEETEKLRANVQMLQSLGVETRSVGRAEIAEIDARLLTNDIEVAAWEPTSGYADPVATTHGFAAAMTGQGGEIELEVEVTAIRAEAGRVVGVETTSGPIATDRVVVAAGAWAAPLLAPFGFDIPLIAKRVQIASFERPDTEPGHCRATLFDGPHGILVRPDGRSHTLVAMTFDPDPVDPDAYSGEIAESFVAECRERVVRRQPTMRGARSSGGWAGVTPETPDGHIVIDELEGCAGLFAAVGCSGTNFKTAPAIGKLLSEWVTSGGPAPADVQAFRASRFAESDPIVGEFEYGASGPDVWR
jgi:sarcosine oxidase, subunit beta